MHIKFSYWTINIMFIILQKITLDNTHIHLTFMN